MRHDQAVEREGQILFDFEGDRLHHALRIAKREAQMALRRAPGGQRGDDEVEREAPLANEAQDGGLALLGRDPSGEALLLEAEQLHAAQSGADLHGLHRVAADVESEDGAADHQSTR